MKVTLRKANALQQSILDLIKISYLTNAVSFNEFENVSEKFKSAENEYINTLNLVHALNDSLYTIRRLVGRANAQEINDLLCDVAFIEKQIVLNHNIATSAPATAINVIEGKLERIKNATDSSVRMYGRADEVSSTIFDETYIKAAKRTVSDLKKMKQKLQDRILELNIKTEIELPPNVVTTLADAGIL